MAAIIVLLIAPLAHAGEPDSSILENDENLSRELTLTLRGPTIREVLRHVKDRTGVRLEADPKIMEDDVPMGNLALKNVPAWKLLEQLSRTQFRGGQWKKTSDGYYLSGTRIESRNPVRQDAALPNSPSYKWLFVFPTVTGLVSLCLLVLYFRARTRQEKPGETATKPAQKAKKVVAKKRPT